MSEPREQDCEPRGADATGGLVIRLHRPESGQWRHEPCAYWEWHGGHTVNYHGADGEPLTCINVGDFARRGATFADVVAGILEFYSDQDNGEGD